MKYLLSFLLLLPICLFAQPSAVFIHDIQGAGLTSGMVGSMVEVSAIVTADFQDGVVSHGDLDGFFIQEEDGDADADANTSEGIFVDDGLTPAIDVAVGDLVTVIGTAMENNGKTEIITTSVTVDASSQPLPASSIIALPAAVVSGMNGYEPDLERYEGMLVQFTGPLTIIELFNLDRFGEMLLYQGSRPFQFTQTNDPSIPGFDMHLQEIASRSITLDDGSNVQNPDPIIHPDGNFGSDDALRTGNMVTGIKGVLDYSGNRYRIQPTASPIFTNDNPRTLTPPVVNGTLKVAALNLFNFFTTIDNGGAICGPNADIGCRGANDMTEYNRQLEKLLLTLQEMDADIVGLMELENNAAAGGGSDPVLDAIVDGLNALLGSTVYDYIDAGIVGSDVIKVGMIYKVGVVGIASGTTVEKLEDSDLAGLGLGALVPVFGNINRTPLAVTFKDNGGQKITVVVNHFKSKGSVNPPTPGNMDQNDGQGNANEVRTFAASALSAWLATDPTGSNDPDVLIIGDLNSFALEDPIKQLESDGYTQLISDPNRYSFVFSGQMGQLDYALGSPSLVSQTTGAGVWHTNVDEADAIDYNLEFGRNPAIFDGTIPNRSADHEPILVGFELDMVIAPIPTMSQWGIIVLSLIMLIFGAMVMNRSKIFGTEV